MGVLWVSCDCKEIEGDCREKNNVETAKLEGSVNSVLDNLLNIASLLLFLAVAVV